MVKSKYFLDTCIFVNSFNKENRKKMKIAKDLIKLTLKSNRGIISHQIIQEFLNEALYSFKNPIKPIDSKIYISDFLFPICEIFPTIELYKNAIDIEMETGFNLNNSLKIAAAIKGDSKIIYSEDLGEISEIKGLRIINPFVE